MSLVIIWRGINPSLSFIQTLTLKPLYSHHLISLPPAAAINFDHLAPSNVHRRPLLPEITKTYIKPGDFASIRDRRIKFDVMVFVASILNCIFFSVTRLLRPSPRSVVAVALSGCLLLCSGCRLPPEVAETGVFFYDRNCVCVCFCFTVKCVWV